MSITSQFQSTLPVWGGTHCFSSFFVGSRFQSTLPVWGGTFLLHSKAVHVGVSIHPPRVGRDAVVLCDVLQDLIVSIHPPRVGRDPRVGAIPAPGTMFQSTLPVWGGTHPRGYHPRGHRGFNPPSPCGEGQEPLNVRMISSCFNPPSPCGEGRLLVMWGRGRMGFNPPSPCGEGRMVAG